MAITGRHLHISTQYALYCKVEPHGRLACMMIEDNKSGNKHMRELRND
jgi:hypothetical protein